MDFISLKDAVSHIVDNRGKTCPTSDAGMPLIATNCVKSSSLYPTKDKIRYVDAETYETWFRGHPEPGDILFVNKGSPGEVCLVPNPVDFCIAQDMVSLRANEKKIDPSYLFAVLRDRGTKAAIENMHVGTMIPHFKKTDFDKLNLPLPSRSDQEFIGQLYLDISKRIALNQKMNQTLEEIAKAIFKSWFVDFDPVRAKAEGRPTGLPPEISDLFPDDLVDSEIGEIPKGWGVKTISDLADCVGGATPSTKNPEFWEGGLHTWTSPKDLSDSKSVHLLKTDRKITEAGLKKISSGLLPVGTVLLSSRAPVGYLALTTEPTAINQGYIALRPKSGISNYFLLHWCESNLDEIKNRASGTTFAEISKAAFRPIPAIEPSDYVMQNFHEFMAAIYERVLISSKEMDTLAELRDTLLPKLISGELRIPDAEKFLEEAGI